MTHPLWDTPVCHAQPKFRILNRLERLWFLVHRIPPEHDTLPWDHPELYLVFDRLVNSTTFVTVTALGIFFRIIKNPRCNNELEIAAVFFHGQTIIVKRLERQDAPAMLIYMEELGVRDVRVPSCMVSADLPLCIRWLTSARHNMTMTHKLGQICYADGQGFGYDFLFWCDTSHCKDPHRVSVPHHWSVPNFASQQFG